MRPLSCPVKTIDLSATEYFFLLSERLRAIKDWRGTFFPQGSPADLSHPEFSAVLKVYHRHKDGAVSAAVYITHTAVPGRYVRRLRTNPQQSKGQARTHTLRQSS